MTINIGDNWDAFMHHSNDILIQSFGDRELASKYHAMFYALKHDRFLEDGTIVLGMRRAPGSQRRHHAFEGGLVVHLMEMWRAWVTIRNLLPPNMAMPQSFNTNALVWRAIVHHDLNKVYKYKHIQKDKDGNTLETWKVDYSGANEDPLGYLLPGTYKSIEILCHHGIPIPPLLLNALITAEGGYSEGPRPQTETVFAKIVYLCDELSANVINRIETDRFWDSKEGGLSVAPDLP